MNLFILVHLSEFFFKNFPIENTATKKLFAIIDPGQCILGLCVNVIQENKISKKVG